MKDDGEVGVGKVNADVVSIAKHILKSALDKLSWLREINGLTLDTLQYHNKSLPLTIAIILIT